MAELIEGVTIAVEARASPMGSFLCVFHRIVPTTGPLRDLLLLSIAGVRSHLAAALAAPFGSRERAAAYWTLGITHSVNLLFCAGWSQHPVSLQRLSSLHPLQEDVVKRWFNAVEHFLAAERPAYHLQNYRVSWGRSGSYGDDVVGESLELPADLVIPAWPAPEVTAKLPLQDSLIGETLEDLLFLERCLKPRSEWPATSPPRAKVHASLQEWFRIVKKGIELGMFHPIRESLIFRDHNGQKVLNGAMAVAKRKRHEDGTETILQRFITNLIPTNSYLRRLRGDAHSLPRFGRLSLITLQDHEQLEVDSEDMP